MTSFSKCAFLLVASSAIWLLGCDSRERDAHAVGQQLKDKAAAAAENTVEYLARQKEELARTLQPKLDEMETKICALKELLDKKAAESKPELDEVKKQLDDKLAVAKTKLAKAKAASKEVWQKGKTEAEAAAAELQKAYEKAWRKLKQNSGPQESGG